jgi:hypothetical protein
MNAENMPPMSEQMRQVLLHFFTSGRTMHTYGRLFVEASEQDDRQFEQDIAAWKAWLQKEATSCSK